MKIARNVLSAVAAIGVLAVAVQKFLSGEAPNYTEIALAISTIAAAVGFQYHPGQ